MSLQGYGPEVARLVAIVRTANAANGGPRFRGDDPVMRCASASPRYTSEKPCANGSRSSMKIVLMPVCRAQPAIEGTMPSTLPTRTDFSTRPLKIEPMIDSWMKASTT